MLVYYQQVYYLKISHTGSFVLCVFNGIASTPNPLMVSMD